VKSCLWEPGVGQAAGKCIAKCASIPRSEDGAVCNSMATCDYSQVGTVWGEAYNTFAKYKLFTDNVCEDNAVFHPGVPILTIYKNGLEGDGVAMQKDYGHKVNDMYDVVALEQCYPMPGGVAYKFSYDQSTDKWTYYQYADDKCQKPSSIQVVTPGSCYQFQSYAKSMPLGFRLMQMSKMERIGRGGPPQFQPLRPADS